MTNNPAIEPGNGFLFWLVVATLVVFSIVFSCLEWIGG